jgi:uncharacterized protein YodC (DUF2158 family)
MVSQEIEEVQGMMDSRWFQAAGSEINAHFGS